MAITRTAAAALALLLCLCPAFGIVAGRGALAEDQGVPYQASSVAGQPAYYVVPEPAPEPDAAMEPSSVTEASAQLPVPEFLPVEAAGDGALPSPAVGQPESPAPIPGPTPSAIDLVPQPDSYPCYTCPNSCGSDCGGILDRCWQRTKACLQESHWGYPAEFGTRPPGTLVRAHARTQIANGLRDQMVLYRYDFYQGMLGDASELNPHGRKRLAELAGLLQRNCFPLIVERIPGKPGLSEARRAKVLKVLGESTFAVPEEWVVVGDPPPVGLSAEEALMIHDNLMSNTEQGGAISGGGQGQSGMGFSAPISGGGSSGGY